MSRETKFRAWDKEDGVYRSVVAIYCYDGEPQEIELKLGRDSTAIVPIKHVVLEQYTGLKDKNDKEIYDGDIFKVERGSVNGVVSFEGMCDSDCTWYYLGWGVNGASLLEWSDMGEVIGNIHENPELIRKDKE